MFWVPDKTSCEQVLVLDYFIDELFCYQTKLIFSDGIWRPGLDIKVALYFDSPL